MAREKRLNIPGGIYHLIGRGNERGKIFRNDTDRKDFLTRLSVALSKTGYQCYAWTLMPNHYHLAVRASEYSLSDLMRNILTGYALAFNRRHERVGHVFRNRYKSILCQEDSYLHELIRYIHLNPVRAKLVKDMKELEKYPWSGHSALCGKVNREFQEIEEVLLNFAETRRKALTHYRKFMAQGLLKGKRPDLTGGGLKRSAGGWVGVSHIKKLKEYWRGDERILGDDKFVEDSLKALEESLSKEETLKKGGWNLEKIAETICKRYSIGVEELVKKGRDNHLSQAKAALCFLAKNELGVSGAELSRYLGISGPAVSKNIKNGEKIVAGKGIKLN